MTRGRARTCISVAIVLAGLYLAAFGNAWAPTALAVLADSELGAWLELVLPFLPMLFVATGAVLLVSPYTRSKH